MSTLGQSKLEKTISKENHRHKHTVYFESLVQPLALYSTCTCSFFLRNSLSFSSLMDYEMYLSCQSHSVMNSSFQFHFFCFLGVCVIFALFLEFCFPSVFLCSPPHLHCFSFIRPSVSTVLSIHYTFSFFIQVGFNLTCGPLLHVIPPPLSSCVLSPLNAVLSSKPLKGQKIT